ncbi:hypothetical protein ACXWPN_10185, partial [Streptococcus pyogenes]
AADNADELAETAEILEATTEDGGQGVDEAGAAMAVAALERCQRLYGIQRTVNVARESFTTRSGRREMTLKLAREAESN